LFERHFSPAQGIQNLNFIRLVPSLVLGLIALVTLAPPAASAVLDYQEVTPTEILLAQRAIAETDTARATNPPVAPYDSLRPPPKDPHAGKSPGKAFLYSLAIPGTGHLYAGYKRGWVNVGIEGLTWITYFYYHDRGVTKEDEFEAYADNHWDYGDWLAECGCQGSPEDSLIVEFRENNPQQYYEDIGKLSTYFGGWDDYNASIDDSANRHYYRGIRADSNNFFQNARYAVIVAFVNRIVSAVDVLRLLKKQGKSVELSSDTKIFIRAHTKPFSSDNSIGLQLTKSL